MLLSEIHTRYEFAQLLGIELKELTYLLYIEKVENLYTTFSIPKKSGGERCINAPQKKLKYIQKLLKVLLESYEEEICCANHINTGVAHAFKKRRSIITNAQKHKNKKYIINIDLENFFDSFNFGRVRGFFIKNKYWNLDPNIATLIAQISCYNGVLPQGAPTSPIITNMICNIMDWHITKIAQKYKLIYTRYADDLTFTTNDKKIVDKYDDFLLELNREIEKSGFKINNSKTRFTNNLNRQVVTGLVVNSKVSINREYYKKTYAMAHSLYRSGEFTIDEKKGTINQLEGRFSFIDQIDKYNNRIDCNIKHDIWHLNHREKKYQEFLFYKYFCANNRPLVITEGKTDIIYLKTAYRILRQDDTKLFIPEDNEIDYGVSFLRKSDRLDYFFNLKKDGASPMTNILDSYLGNKTFKISYYEQLMAKYKITPNAPVILLYDNELNKKGAVRDVINSKKLDIESLKEKNYIRVIGNLYIQVVPLVKGKEDCEIEDLITENVDDLIIEGRHFDRKGKADKEKFYNKDVLSHYIEEHENEFHFDCFKELFKTWDLIIEDYNSLK
ncbi:retron Ec67 family RNA-directed DNA polymerase/endonuclease [Butyrivibrio fibrisolvens]|uniref:retron Ec67 family RNA-directed DNA polymerase/endonuclease n=1 Tax=Butyrivibrio fibrisolvens TaxID=831 RepID=UPI00042561AB|nr:retron Ec67 family RNA-directed DNA polymerase/endonuclease [Butyrivibrio fibrisolvens]